MPDTFFSESDRSPSQSYNEKVVTSSIYGPVLTALAMLVLSGCVWMPGYPGYGFSSGEGYYSGTGSIETEHHVTTYAGVPVIYGYGYPGGVCDPQLCGIHQTAAPTLPDTGSDPPGNTTPRRLPPGAHPDGSDHQPPPVVPPRQPPPKPRGQRFEPSEDRIAPELRRPYSRVNTRSVSPTRSSSRGTSVGRRSGHADGLGSGVSSRNTTHRTTVRQPSGPSRPLRPTAPTGSNPSHGGYREPASRPRSGGRSSGPRIHPD